MYRLIAIKLSILTIVFAILNIIYSTYFYEDDLKEHSEIIYLVRDMPTNTDILYFGESSNNTYRSDDIDKRSISAFIGDCFPNLLIWDITKNASHAGIYQVLLGHVPKEYPIKSVVITLNLRSFNATWIYSELETSLQKSLVLLKPFPPLFNKFLLSFKSYDIKTNIERERQYKEKWESDVYQLPFNFPFKNVIEWDKWKAQTGVLDSTGTRNQKQTELACHYIKTYGFQIDTIENPRIKEFNKIIQIARDRNYNIIFNLLAENTEKAEQLVGSELIFMMNENTNKLERYFSNKGVTVVNNLNSVANEQYIDQDWTTEHYAEKGRKIIAHKVAEALKNYHPNEYIAPVYKNVYQTSFFNNCDDNKIIWSQMQTITNEKAYSGSKSSITGAGNDFSITLEYPLKIIPDSIKKHIYVQLMIYQSSINHRAQLVVEASGESFRHHFIGYNINNTIKTIDNWKLYNTTIIIPDSIKNADVIKIYVYNPSNEKIFIDDFKVSILP